MAAIVVAKGQSEQGPRRTARADAGSARARRGLDQVERQPTRRAKAPRYARSGKCWTRTGPRRLAASDDARRRCHLGSSCATIASVLVREGASGTEIHNLGITGTAPTATGLAVSGAEEVVVEGVWVHDVLGYGIEAVNALGPTSVTLRHSLVERNEATGVVVFASVVSLTDMVIRDNGLLPPTPRSARGIDVETDDDQALGATVEIRHSVVERHFDHGINLSGAQGVIDSTLVRDTLARPSDGLFGRGIGIQRDPATGLVAAVAVTSTVVEGNTDAGIFVYGANATLTGVVASDTRARPDQDFGRGINVQAGAGADTGSNVTLQASLIARTFDVGLFTMASTVDVAGLWIRDVAARPGDALFGDGIVTHSGNTLALVDSLIQRTARAGLGAFDAAASLRATRIGCSAFPLTTEAGALTEEGNVLCACPVEEATDQDVCKAVQAGVEPPDVPSE